MPLWSESVRVLAQLVCALPLTPALLVVNNLDFSALKWRKEITKIGPYDFNFARIHRIEKEVTIEINTTYIIGVHLANEILDPARSFVCYSG